jgi:putative alpha-1,2-mannosidase
VRCAIFKRGIVALLGKPAEYNRTWEVGLPAGSRIGIEYAIGRPFFPKATVHLTWPKKHDFTIVAHNLTPENNYVKSIKLDGKPMTMLLLKHTDLFNHKLLEFEMGPGTK